MSHAESPAKPEGSPNQMTKKKENPKSEVKKQGRVQKLCVKTEQKAESKIKGRVTQNRSNQEVRQVNAGKNDWKYIHILQRTRKTGV